MAQQNKDNQAYHDQMERELQILKRQNPNIKYERPIFKNSEKEEDNLFSDERNNNPKHRILKETLTNDQQQLIKDLNLDMPIFDISGTKCQKSMNYNQDSEHIYNNNLSAEEQLEAVQRELSQTKASAMKSNRDIVIEQIKNKHNKCYFGATSAYNSVAFQTYHSYCSDQNQMNHFNYYENKQFQTLARSAHIKLHEIDEKYLANHSIKCGVEPINITHGLQSNSITQYITYICFNPNQSESVIHSDL